MRTAAVRLPARGAARHGVGLLSVMEECAERRIVGDYSSAGSALDELCGDGRKVGSGHLTPMLEEDVGFAVTVERADIDVRLAGLDALARPPSAR